MMTHLLPSYTYIPNSLSIESSQRNGSKGRSRIRLNEHSKSNCGQQRLSPSPERNNSHLTLCCTSSSPTSSEEELGRIDKNEGFGRYEGEKMEKLQNLVSEYGWKVRRLNEEEAHEMRKVAHIQAEAFHTPLALFDDFFFEFFKAEVLSALVYKLRNSPPDRYACLVAEPAADTSKPQSKLVGIVDVTVLRDEDVLGHLAGAQEYLYVSGLAVSKAFRRRKIASALLKACDVLAVIWGFQYLVLRAYEDDFGALTLYSKAGYRVVSGDPPWMTSWIGRKRRVLMIKRSTFT